MGLASGAYVRCRNSKKPKKIARLRTDKGAAIDQSKVAAPGLYSIERCMKPKYRLPITSGQGKGSKGQKERNIHRRPYDAFLIGASLFFAIRSLLPSAVRIRPSYMNLNNVLYSSYPHLPDRLTRSDNYVRSPYIAIEPP